MESTKRYRLIAEDVLILVIGAVSLAVLISNSFPSMRYVGHLRHLLELESMTARLYSVVLLIVLYNLYQRRRAAWWITVVFLGLGFLRHFLPVNRPYWPIGALEAASLTLLLCFQADFCCPSSRRSLRQSLLMLALAGIGILFNAGISYHYVRLRAPGAPRSVALWDSLTDAWSILFGLDGGSADGTPMGRFETAMFWFSWVCMLLALLYVLKPWITRFFWTEERMRRAREIVLAYGQNPASHLTLEKDKLLYFGRGVKGVLPYGIVGSTVVVNGDPVCAPEDFAAFLAEFREFCRRSDHKIFFLSITDRYLETYKKQGFGIAKCGEEARFLLADYDIAGKKGAKMRMNINHASKAGVTVAEYRPLEQRDAAVESAMNRITAEWLKEKKSGLLSFTMGTTGLDAPMDRRYFYAKDAAGQICAFNVYCPYDGGRGYMADITRRSHGAPGGVTEKIMYEAFGVFRAEGVESVSMGLAPLANVLPEGARPNSVEWLLHFVYEHLNACYGFKDLYRAKENYSPTEWLPGYYAWLPRVPTPAMFYAVARIQNPKGLTDYAFAILRARREEKQRQRRAAAR